MSAEASYRVVDVVVIDGVRYEKRYTFQPYTNDIGKILPEFYSEVGHLMRLHALKTLKT